MIGRTISHYEIVEKLGSGGMGDVYVARDTQLDRDVALKVLPPHAASTPERRSRFEREAKAVAAIDHPNIVTVHSVEESEGVHFITMELVRGKTLTELIPSKGLTLPKFFDITVPLADAVSAAHERGITHRDLKPDNLMVSVEGRLKILDFGLAKMKHEIGEAGASDLPTKTHTEEGRVLGTVAYMSPEQAEGKKIDIRSDLFSMGIVFYEMATGGRPFNGETAASVLSSVIKDTPPSVTEVRPEIPRELGKIIRRCLVKDPEHRYQSAKDLRNELEELKQDIDSGELERAVASPTSRRGRMWIAAGIAVAVVTALVTILVWPERPASPRRGGIFTNITSQAGRELFPSLSPDGEFVIYASRASGNWDIYRQRVGGETAFNLTEDCTADDLQPAFSPDGEHIAFRSEREGGGLFLMGATGESVRRLADSGFNPSWSPAGQEIVFATVSTMSSPGNRHGMSRIWALAIDSGAKKLVTEHDGVQPSWSPNGHRIAFWSVFDEAGTKTNQRDIWTVPADGGDALPVTRTGSVDWNPVWSSDGRYLYFSSDRGRARNVWRVRIDERTGRTLSQPEVMTPSAAVYHCHITFPKDGRRMAYVEEVVSSDFWKVAFDPFTGRAQGDPVPVTQSSDLVQHPDVSSDGEWLVYASQGKREDLYIMRVDGTGRRQLTDDAYVDRFPKWSPDGKTIAFYSSRSGRNEIWSIHSDGSGLRQLTEIEAAWPSWSPDGRRIAGSTRGQGTFVFDPALPWKDQTVERLPPVDDVHVFTSYSWSPSGGWLAGWFPGSGGIAVYSLEARQYRMLTDFGFDPVWLRDSRRLLFHDTSWDRRGIHLVDIETGSTHEVLSIRPERTDVVTVSPDDRWIYFERFGREADIWLLDLPEER